MIKVRNAALALFRPSVLMSAVVMAFAVLANAQSEVKWHPLIGHDKEFVIFMPADYKTFVDEPSRIAGKNRSNAVDVNKTVKVSRLINGTVLSMYFYEANGEALYKQLSSSTDLALGSERTAGKLKIKRYAGPVRGRHAKTHYFIGKGTLYVATANSPSEKDPIAEAFLSSVRIVDENGTYIAPNAASDNESTGLPLIKERAAERSPDSVVFDESEVDREAILLYQPRFRSTADAGIIPQSGRVTATAVLSASGTVTNVKTGGNASFELQKAYAESIKGIVFIPAEKDGKLVSVTKKFSWEMTIEVRSNVRILEE